MKYPKLRIAFSVTCGIACVLLMALWVRSYSMPLRLLRANTARTDTIGRAKVAMAVAGPQSIRPHALSVAVPHWLLLLVAATLAAIPWTNWRFRFNLRTFQIATTLVAVVLGLIVYASK